MTPDPLVTRLVLVRHAESEAARGDEGLSDLGELQAGRLLHRALESREFRSATLLVTSDLRRAVRTAEVIAPGVGSGLGAEQDPDLRELSVLRTGKDDERVDGGGHAIDPTHPGAGSPHGETWPEFERRARSALRRHAATVAGSTAIVVCHTGVIEASFVEFAGLDRRSQRFAMRPRNTAITAWASATDGRAEPRWRLEAYNDAAHLWRDGFFLHGSEDFDVLASGDEPFWAAVKDVGHQ